ncbi:MAG: gamma carbonic anhydrase family protein [Gammaproteobacteria bacterium]|nr:MAG: gamma carbonic anhydrase family protein [Gammaproteobacteria bacterium]
MTIRSFDGRQPQIDPSAWVDDSAVVIGDVTLGPQVSVWPTCVLRGDVGSITVGELTNIQDGTVVHVTHDGPWTPGGFNTTIGKGVTIGHRAIVHACTVGDWCLIGMGAILMDGAELGARSILAAGALVPAGKKLEGGWLYVGSPARAVRALTDTEFESLEYSAAHYAKLMAAHRDQ